MSLFCSPATTPALALAAQEKLLAHFLKRSVFEVKATRTHHVNYVIIRRKDHPDNFTTDASAVHSGVPSIEDSANKAASSAIAKAGSKSTGYAAISTDDIEAVVRDARAPSTSSQDGKDSDDVRKHQPRKQKTLVLMHGFGLGLGFFYDNFDDLASHFDQVIAVDWLGMGCSSRISTRITRLSLLPSLLLGQGHEDRAKIIAEQVANEFIESLDEVREQEGLTEFVLAGHSLGGYLSGKYALRYPQYLEGLVLISPAGVPEHPLREHRVEIEELDWKIRLLHSLWHLNVTPQSLIRIAGKSRGPEWIETAIKRRFSGVSSATLTRWQEEELKLLSDYLYHITAAPGNGEYALNALLQPIFVKQTALNDPPERKNRRNDKELLPDEIPPIQARRTGVYARAPLENDIAEKLSTLPRKLPIYLIFGDHDWLYYPGAANTVKEWTNKGIPSELEIIRNAGHHLYLENAKELNEQIIEWTKKNVIGYEK